MTKRKLTPEEVRAYRQLARAAKRLRRAQHQAEKAGRRSKRDAR